MPERTNRRARRVRALAGLLLLGLAAALMGSATAREPDASPLRSAAPERYTVAPGDTLWGIAERFLHAPWQWPEVWRVNPEIRNPDLIYPGDIIYLHTCDGRPCLGLERGQGVVRLSPEVRTTPRREAIAPLPLEAVRHFLRDQRIVDDPDSLEELAYVVGGDDRRLISGPGDRLYARGEVAGRGRVGFYRMGQAFHDAESGELLGLELEGVGQARRERQEGDIAVLEVTAVRQEVRNDDIVLPLEAGALHTEFVPRAPERDVQGAILGVPGSVQFIGRLQVVALNLGRRDGLEAGHVLAVAQQGEIVSDPRSGEPLRLPGEEAGLVMVFRPYEKMSYALVMRASRMLAVGDRVHSPAGLRSAAGR